MVSSLDGFIAKKGNDTSWMESSWCRYPKGISFEEGAKLMEPIDCYIMGSKTYELALKLGWVYGEDTKIIVVTSRQLSSSKNNVEFYTGNLTKLKDWALSRYFNIWLVGGALLSQEFLKLKLVDQICLTVAPVLLGKGVAFFGKNGNETKLMLKDTIAFENGMIDMWYVVLKD